MYSKCRFVVSIDTPYPTLRTTNKFTIGAPTLLLAIEESSPYSFVEVVEGNLCYLYSGSNSQGGAGFACYCESYCSG